MVASVKIDKKIVGYSVADTASENDAPAEITKPDLEFLDEKMERPAVLFGATIKVNTPVLEGALYVNINHYTLNEDTPEAQNVPFEIFINGAENDHVQWVRLSTRLITSIWRKGGNTEFIIDDMKKTGSEDGGYFIPGSKGKRAKSLVAHIGFVIEEHLIRIGYLKGSELSPEQQALISQKSAAVQSKPQSDDADDSDFPAHATVCPSCSVKAVVLLDNCQTCLSCSSSKCG